MSFDATALVAHARLDASDIPVETPPKAPPGTRTEHGQTEERKAAEDEMTTQQAEECKSAEDEIESKSKTERTRRQEMRQRSSVGKEQMEGVRSDEAQRGRSGGKEEGRDGTERQQREEEGEE